MSDFVAITPADELESYRAQRAAGAGRLRMGISRAYAVELAVRELDRKGVYPSPGAIQRELGDPVTHNISGRDCRAREAALEALGWEYVPAQNPPFGGKRWRKP